MIELNRVSKSFGRTLAVRDISFKVSERENLVLLGTSGCGKTTTLKMINRLIEPDAGKINIGGKDIGNENPDSLRRGIGYVMQNIGLFPHYTISENISVTPRLLRWGRERIDARVNELIKKLHLPFDCLTMFPHELSGGQQQRVGLARALAANPPVLLMDEPFGALDNVTKASIQAEFKALEELRIKTIVMVTHDVQEAFELADRICLMDEGRVVQIGTPLELLYRPVNDFARKFLDGQRISLEFKVVGIKDIWGLLPESTVPLKEATVSSEISVWAALEHLRSSVSECLHIKHVSSGEQKAIGFQDITNAFSRHQKAMSHE